ncbi:MAG TPA: hypothetical protein VFH83_07295 [Spirochaetia bacterium]|nr:hypothetical protein [Spirochaetia bacterium]
MSRMAIDPSRLTVPGNMLLLGEYAVLEEGGLGIAVAVERRVRFHARPSDRFRIEGVWPGGAMRWTGPQDGNPVITETVASVTSWAEHSGIPAHLPGATLRVDSTELFDASGRKAGFGSSAAVTVGLTCQLTDLLLVRAARAPADADALVGLALESHRRAQGGVGSGYDVLSSFHGGVGAFRGGRHPTWEASRISGLLDLALFRGKAPISTADSVRRYQEWKRRDPAAAVELLERSNAAVSGFLAATTASMAFRWFSAAREIGLALGERIGVSAGIEPPPGVDPAQCKAVGAGNELGVYVFEPGSRMPPGRELERLSVADRGLRRG